MEATITRGKGVRIVLTVGMVALLLFAACAAPAPAEKRKTAKIGLIANLTGPVATANQLGLLSLRDGLRYWNEEIGIPGVTVELLWRDSKYDRSLEMSAYRSYIEAGAVAVVIFTPPGMFKAMVERDQVPMLAGSITGDTMYPAGWIFGYSPTEAERFAVLADWIVFNWKEELPPRMGIIVPETEYTVEPLDEFEAYANKVGIELLPVEFVPYLVLDSTIQLLRLSERGADFVLVGPHWSVALPVLKDAQRLGLTARIQFCGMEATLSKSVVTALGPLLEGYFVTKACPAWTEVENPGIKWAQEVYRRYHGAKEIPDYYEESIIRASAILPEAIRIAIRNAGYDNIDGRSVKAALETLEDFDPYGYGTPISYRNPEVRRGSGLARIYEVQAGQVIAVSEWREAPIIRPVR